MVFVVILAFGVLILVIELIRRHMMREKYSLLWVMISFLLISIPLLYDYYVRLAALVGIQDPNSFFFYCAIMGLMLFCLQFTLSTSSASRHRRVLTQELALVEKRVRDLEEKLKKKND